MNWQVKVLRKVEAMDGDEVTFGLPDEDGQVVTLKGDAEGNLDALVPGALYTLAFVPFVQADDLDAVDTPEDVLSGDLVQTDHPTVIQPYDAASASSPDVMDIEVDDPGLQFEFDEPALDEAERSVPPVAEAATEDPSPTVVTAEFTTTAPDLS